MLSVRFAQNTPLFKALSTEKADIYSTMRLSGIAKIHLRDLFVTDFSSFWAIGWGKHVDRAFVVGKKELIKYDGFVKVVTS